MMNSESHATTVFDSLRVRSIVLGMGLGIVAGTILREFLLAIGLKPSATDLFFFGFIDVWIFMWIRRKLNKSTVKLSEFLGRLPGQSNWTQWTGITVGLYVFTIGCIFLFLHPLSYFAAEYVESLILADGIYGNLKPASALVPQFVLLVIASPFVEEIVFRGVVLQRWATKWGLRKSIIFSSLIFAIIHPTDPIGSFFFGLVMASLFIRTGSLWVPIFCHSLYNAIPYLLQGMEYSLTGRALLASERWAISQPWICVMCLLATGPWIVRFVVKNWPGENCQIPYDNLPHSSPPQ